MAQSSIGQESSASGSGKPPQVEIYTWQFCPYCIRAKALLDRDCGRARTPAWR